MKHTTRLFILLFFITAFSLSAQGQQQEKERKEPDRFLNAFMDWVALSYATYTGELDAEAGSVFSKLLNRYRNNNQLNVWLSEMDELGGGLESESRDFFKQTGTRVYFVGEFTDVDKVPYLHHFNKLFREKIRHRSAPWLLVTVQLGGNNKEGYQVKLNVEGSEELNLRKYDLDKANNRNPFWGVVQPQVNGRSFSSTIRQGLVQGLVTLGGSVKEDFLPPLLISYRGMWYKSGEEIRVNGSTNEDIQLTAIGRDGGPPSGTGTWTVDPATNQALLDGNQLTLPTDIGGTLTISAQTGEGKVSISLQLVDVAFNKNEILKQLLLEVIAPMLEKERQKQNDLQTREGPTREATENSLADLERYNYPISEGTNTLTPLQETPRTLTPAEEDVFNADQDRNTAFERIKSQKQLQVDLQKAVQLIEYIQQVVDNDETRNQVVDDMLKPENLGSVLGQFTVTMLNGNAEEDVKTLITNYLNDNLSRLAGEDVTLSALQPFRIVANNNLPDTYDPANNYYINPKLPYTDAQFAELEQEIADYQAVNPGAFVVVNYSQDVNRESFLERVPKGTPLGLEEGQAYKVINIANYPGSIFGDRADYESGTSEEEDDIGQITVTSLREGKVTTQTKITAVSPSGDLITLPNKLSITYDFTPSVSDVPFGSLTQFKYTEDNEEYWFAATYKGDKFLGYYKIKDPNA
ncbi:MAG: hypothetical protein AAGA66_18045, partial [Bacteroidota bacterium]